MLPSILQHMGWPCQQRMIQSKTSRVLRLREALKWKKSLEGAFSHSPASWSVKRASISQAPRFSFHLPPFAISREQNKVSVEPDCPGLNPGSSIY